MPWSRSQLQQLPAMRRKQFLNDIIEWISSECVALAGNGSTHFAWDTTIQKRKPKYEISVSEIALALTDELVGCDISIENKVLHVDWS